MRVLLDECVPRALRRDLPGHAVRTVVEMGWNGVKNGELLRRAATHFDVFVTVDQNARYQQNLTTISIPVVVLVAVSNDINLLRPLPPKILEVLLAIEPGQTYEIDA